MAYIADIVDYLEDSGAGTVGQNIFQDYKPNENDEGIFVLDSGGFEPDPEAAIYNPTFQVFIRANTWLDGNTLLDTVRDTLHRVSNQQLVDSGVYFYYILAMAQGGYIGRDEQGRYEFSINFRAKYRSA